MKIQSSQKKKKIIIIERQEQRAMFKITNSFIILFGRAHETSCSALDLYNNWFFPSSLLQFNILKDIGRAVYDDNHGGLNK